MSDAIKALCKAQTEMGKAIKNAKNPHLKSNYADLGAVMEACFDALHSNGFAVMQPGGADEFGPYVETVFAHESGDTFRSRVYLVIGKQDMQGVGSAITYARRYGLLGMAGLAPEDDDGEATKKAPQPRRELGQRETRPWEEDLPAYDPIGARDRLLKAISARKTKQALRDLYRAESAALKTLHDADKPKALEVEKAFTDAAAKLPDDPAMQAPPEAA